MDAASKTNSKANNVQVSPGNIVTDNGGQMALAVDDAKSVEQNVVEAPVDQPESPPTQQ
jgi:hypothetical protein